MAQRIGLRKRILTILKNHEEIMSDQVALLAGCTQTQASNALFKMPEVYKIKKYEGRTYRCIYSLKPFDDVIEEVVSKPKKQPTRRYIPEFKPMHEGSYNLYEGRQLAMLAR